MSAPGIPVVFLGLCLLLGVRVYGEDYTSIRPNLPSRCNKEADTRPCSGFVAFRWYYDKYSDSCKVFPYRGCPSTNANNFKSRQECMGVCIKTPDTQPPKPWRDTPNHDEQLDEIYGEPVAKPSRADRIPFVKNVDPETIEVPSHPHRPPVEGRSLHVSHNGPNYRRPNGPPMNPGYHSEPNHYGRNVGFPPRNSQPNRGNGNPMNGPGGFDIFTRSQKSVQNNMGPYNGNHDMRSQRMPPRAAQQVQRKAPGNDFMTKEDIFDKVSNPSPKPKDNKPEKPTLPTEFMSDSDIFDSLPEISIPTKKTVEGKKGATAEKSSKETKVTKEIPVDKSDELEGDPENGGVFVNPEDAPVCMQFPETGPCKAYIRRWYFDPRKAECFTFIYGGCEGNKNSFQTKEDCLKTCTSSNKAEPKASEDTKPPPSNRHYFGLRRQGRKNSPLPVVMTSTPTEAKPVEVTSAPDMEPEPKMAKVDPEEEEKSQEDSSEEEEEEGQGNSSGESKEAAGEGSSEKEKEEKSHPPVVNHYYTYHNYGPRHETHGTVRTTSQSKEDNDNEAESSSSSSSSEEEEVEKKIKKKVKGNSMSRRLPSPINIFFRFLKRLRPRKPKIIIRANGETEKGRDNKGVSAKQSGITFVKLFFTKKGRKNDQDQDRISPLSPLAGFRLPYRTNPFSDIFSEPEGRRGISQYEESPMPQPQPQPHSYSNGPFPPSPGGDYYQQHHHHHYQQPPPLPPPEPPMSNRFSSNPLLLPPLEFIPPWNPLFYQEPGLLAPPGEKNLGCGKPVDEGVCHDRLSVPRWYYDQERGICDVFYYTGCGGNENRFDTYKQCHDVCMVRSPPPPVNQALPEEQPGQVETEVTKPEKEAKVLDTKKEETATTKVTEGKVTEEKVTKVKATKEEKDGEQNEAVVKEHLVHSAPAVVHTFEFANMHLDNRMEYVLVVVIMILGGAALIVLVAITAYFMYKKHKLATRAAKEANIQKVFRAHAYPEVHKISVIELPRELPGVHESLK